MSSCKCVQLNSCFPEQRGAGIKPPKGSGNRPVSVQDILIPFLRTATMERGVYSGRKNRSTRFCGLGWLKNFPRVFLISGNGFGGCVRKTDSHTVRRTKTKKAETDSVVNRSPLSYFQSFSISSSAISNAVFRLFSIMLNISASRTDCSFFFFFLSFSFYWLI